MTGGDHKSIVIRFNREIIEQGNPRSAAELFHPDFVNRSAPPGSAPGKEGMLNMFDNILRPAFPDLRVEILDQIAEGDKVVTRKAIHGTHTGTLLGIEPTGRKVTVNVIDIVRIRDGRYYEHWGINNFASVVESLKTLGTTDT
jgi:predicted ester cyclase